MKKALLLLIVLNFITETSFSQNTKLIDSLKNVYTKLEDGIPKIKTLEELYYAEVYTNPKKGQKYAKEGLKLSAKLKNWSGLGVAYYHIGVYHKLTSSYDSAYYYYNKSLEVWNEHPNIKLKASTLSAIAGIEQENGNFNKAIGINKEVIKINKENGFWLNYGIGLGNLGDLYKHIGNYKLAYEMSLEGLKVLDTVPEEPWRDADLRRQIANIEISRGNYEEALKFLEKALETYTETDDQIFQGHTYVDMGNAEHELKHYKKAIAYYEKGLEIGKKINVIDMQANALSNIGMSNTKLGNYNDAITFLKKAIEINKMNNSVSNLIASMGEMGNAYRANGEINESLAYFNEAIKLADSSGLLSLKSMALTYRAKAYEQKQNFAKALNDTKAYNAINDSLYDKQKSQQIEELKAIYQSEQKESEIALQKQEIKALSMQTKNDKLTKTLYGIGMVAFLIITGLTYFSFKQRMKKNKIEREKQEAIYKQEIEFKKKELATQTLHLVQKNTFIQELKENLVKIKQSPELFKVEFRRLVMLLKKESAEDKDWEVFKSYFTEVHNNFDHKLKAVYKDINEKEMRLSSYLRMNLSTKEIASMLNVLPESVLKSKYRLKKKLNLDKETDLNQFLSDL